MTGKRLDLIWRLTVLVVVIEATVFGLLGGFYVREFGRAAENQLQSRLRIVSQMIAANEFAVSVISRQDLIGDFVGAPYASGLAIGGGGRVIAATDPDLLGRAAHDAADLPAEWISTDAPDERFVEAGETLCGIFNIKSADGHSSIYHLVMKVSTAELARSKRSILLRGVFGSLLFIALSSAGVILVVRELITRRVKSSLEILAQVEAGRLDARIPVTTGDELGRMQTGINAMIESVGGLLQRQQQITEDLRSQRSLLRSIIDHAPIRVFWKDRNLRYVGCNQLFAEDAGLNSPDDIVGQDDFDQVWRDQAQAYQDDDRKILETGRPKLEYEEVQSGKDGKVLWLSTSKVPLFGEDDKVIGVLGIYRDITERRIMEAAKIRAEAANEAKSSFLANMSHEIRTPLNAIRGFTLLLKRSRMNADQADKLGKIDSAARHLLSIIDNILDYSKIEAGKLTLEPTDFSIGALLDEVLSLVGEAARGKGLSVAIETDAVPRWLRGDLTRLRQALLNYAGNAVKFTEQGGIVLRARLIEEKSDDLLIRFEVQDSGIGIAPERLAGLFQPFEQADVSTTRKFGGTGLGLAITRRLARLMEGEAGADSTLGEGSTFWFTARLRRSVEPTTRDVAKVASAEMEDRLRADHGGARLLLAEDDAINQEVALELLADTGLSIDVAGDGRRAVNMAREVNYDLILMDMQMPEMDGIEATRAIRALPGRSSTPIVAMTANVFADDRRRCMDAGMNDFVGKPVEPEELFEKLLKWLPSGKMTIPPSASAKPEVTIEQSLGAIPGLDVATGLRLTDGKIDLYVRVVRMYADNYSKGLPAIRSRLAAADTDEARRLAHSLKGASATIGALALQAAAAELEKAIVNHADDIGPRLDALEAELKRMTSGLQAALGG